MGHLNEQDMAELLFGETTPWSTWWRRRHLKKCGACREHFERLCREQEEQKELARQLKCYGECLQEAEKTMTMPKPPAAEDN